MSSHRSYCHTFSPQPPYLCQHWHSLQDYGNSTMIQDNTNINKVWEDNAVRAQERDIVDVSSKWAVVCVFLIYFILLLLLLLKTTQKGSSNTKEEGCWVKGQWGYYGWLNIFHMNFNILFDLIVLYICACEDSWPWRFTCRYLQPVGFLPTDPGDLWENFFEGAGMAFEVQNTCGPRCIRAQP